MALDVKSPACGRTDQAQPKIKGKVMATIAAQTANTGRYVGLPALQRREGPTAQEADVQPRRPGEVRQQDQVQAERRDLVRAGAELVAMRPSIAASISTSINQCR